MPNQLSGHVVRKVFFHSAKKCCSPDSLACRNSLDCFNPLYAAVGLFGQNYAKIKLKND